MTTQSVAGKKVLIVEDVDATRKALVDVIERHGLVALEAKNGMEGFEAAYKERPDIILLDILMPLIDGWEMLSQLRKKDDWGKAVPVVILTNLSADEDVQIRHVAELGPSLFMVKADWKVEGIVAKVLELLSAPKLPAA
jgi:CheY-like chemotaxis protein